MPLIWCLVLLGLSLYANCTTEPPPPCFSNVYCYGDLLKVVQMSKIYTDSKTFVDMKMKHKPSTILEKFAKWQNTTKPDRKSVTVFVNQNFEPPGSEFETWIPVDWKETPEFLSKIKNENLRNMGSSLNAIWKDLGRKIRDEVKENPELYSIIYVKNGVIVPGGRFREFYYWDSYWIILGLLLSEMNITVRGMLENFADIVNKFGHIPNGGRVYYLERSQPPLFIPMVKLYYDYTEDIDFIKTHIETFEKEYSYWINRHMKKVELNGKTYELATYGDRSYGPRPESYREDYESAMVFKEDHEREAYYSELKAAAESGWDFSSRWFIDGKTNKGNLTSIKSRSIVPVDLNAILYWNAVILSDFYTLLGNPEKSNEYQKAAEKWLEVVTEVLWHEDVGAWLDYDLENKMRRDYFYPSNVVPLWTKCYPSENKASVVKLIRKYLQNNNALNAGGVPTSFEESGEQWDYPNAWPPLQHMLVVGLNETGDPYAQKLAFEIAERWVISNYKAFVETDSMFEKYNAFISGGHGGGGEYEVQLGFGWSNGVVMDFLDKFGQHLRSDFAIEKEPDHPYLDKEYYDENEASSTALQVSTVLVALLVSFTAGYIGISIYRKRSGPQTTKSGKGRPSSWHYQELKSIQRRSSTRSSR